MSSILTLKSAVNSTGLYSIAVLTGRLSGLLLLPVYTRYLTPADYGVFELLELTTWVFAALVGMRFGDALMYYYSRATSTVDRDKVVSSLYFCSVLVSVVGGLTGFVLAPQLSHIVFNNTDYILYFRLAFVSLAFNLSQEVALCYLRTLDRAQAYVGVSLIQLLLVTVFNLTTLIGFGWGLTGVLASKVVISFLMAVGLIIYTLRPVRISIDWALIPRAFRYGAPLGISGVALLIVHYGDRFFLQRYVSLAEIGIYALAYKLGMMVSFLFMPFDIYWSSQRFRLVKGPAGSKLFVRICTYEMLLLTPVVMGLALFSEGLLHLLAGPAFVEAARYAPWIAGAYLIRTIGTHFRNVFILEGRTEWEAIIAWVGALICLGAYWVLVPRYTLWGAVAATGLAFTVMLILSFYTAQRFCWFDYEYRRLAIILVAAAVPVILFSVLRPAEFWLRQGVAIGLTCLYPGLLWLLRFPAEDEMQAFRIRLFRASVVAAQSGTASVG